MRSKVKSTRVILVDGVEVDVLTQHHTLYTFFMCKDGKTRRVLSMHYDATIANPEGVHILVSA